MSKNNRQIYINLPIRDIKRSMEFFSRLGFEFNPKFSDDNAACMVINPDAYVMLLAEPYFKTFTKKQICDTSTHSEGLLAISCTSKADVDELVNKALGSGGTKAMDPVDHGFMYGWSFYDLDGHHWEVMWMDPSAAEG
ncbi:MAG TPA: VOC family protein [Kofleriaceae bacterium]|nr:VOC family protein [Kofleriaceae bacterium]